MKNLFSQARAGYRNLRLQTKFTITHLVITTLPMLVLFLFFYGKLYNMVVADTIRTEQAVSARTTPMIEEIVDRVLDTHGRLRAMPFYSGLFHADLADTGEMTVAAGAENFQTQAKSLIDGELVTDIRIFIDLPGEHPVFSGPDNASLFLPMKKAQGSYWYGIFQGGNYKALYCPSFYLSPYEVKNYGPLAYITKSTILYEGEFRDCFTAVYYSKDPFTRLLSDNLTAAGSVSYLINDRNSLVATSDEALAGIYHFDYETVRDSFMSSNNFILKNVIGEDVYAGFYNIGKAEWFMVVVMPSRPIIAKSVNIMLGFLLVYLGCIITAFFIATRLSKSITNRLSSVISRMARVRTGPPVPLPASESHDEIGNLIDTYNYMAKVMNQLMEDQAKAAEDLRIAEFNSLQAQINPHFLYNTMDMINWLAQKGRPREVSSAVQDLSRFYKLTLSRKEKITTIASEIEHAAIYVRLQNMRYNDGIDFVVDVPDYLMDYHIPKLTFQPVVENSILHGLLEKEGKEGTIVLTGWLEDDAVVILISDDGVGIPPEKLPGILSGESGGKGNNIAVYNTHRRLQLLYGLDYGLTYQSEPGKGTEVEIRVPARQGHESGNAPKTLSAKTYLPLVTVSRERKTPDAFDTVSPLTLLRYNKKITSDTYKIHNLHQISDKLSKGEDIYILSHMVTEDFPAHTHDYFEINYVCQGAVIDVVDSRELYTAAGDMIILNRQAVQSLKYCKPNTLLLNFCLHQPLFEHTLKGFYQGDTTLARFLRGETAGANYIFYPLGHSLKAQSVISSIIQEYAGAGFHQTPSLEALFLLLLEHLAHSKEFSFSGVDENTLRALQYLRANCLTETVPDMAAALGYSAGALRELLRTRLGRELEDIIQEVRLNHALQLLAQPKLNIYQIAGSCGYQDPNRFFEEFKAQFGIPPEEYRRQFI